MSELNVPEGMPELQSGGHVDPSGGACVMEYISVIKGESFSDYPECTEPLVAHAAQCANDMLLSHERTEAMLPRLERIMNAVPLPSPIRWHQSEFAPDRQYPDCWDMKQRSNRYGIDYDVPEWVFQPNGTTTLGQRVVKWLDAVLDQYERVASELGVKAECPVSVTLTENAVHITA